MFEIDGLQLGPKGADKIAILGTAPSSMELAPFKDMSWAIWACSPAAYSVCAKNRSDVWFEPHRWMPTPPGQFGAPGTKPWFSPEFDTFLSKHKGPVFMSGVQPSIPSSVRIPYESLIKKYGHYFWSSTICYMLAMAIDQRPKAIGLWGIDMSAREEYDYQRPAVQHFIGLAMAMGIDVVIPAESDIMRPSTMYGIGEHSPRHIKMLARLAEIRANKAAAQAAVENSQRTLLQLAGAEAELAYMLKHWCDDITPDLRQAVSYAPEYNKSVGFLSSEVAQAAVPEKPVRQRRKKLNGSGAHIPEAQAGSA